MESLLQVYFCFLNQNTSVWKIYFNYTSELEDKCISLESLLQIYNFNNLDSLSQVFLSLKINVSISKVHSKYTIYWFWKEIYQSTSSICLQQFRKSISSPSEFENKHINIQSLLKLYYWVWKEMHQSEFGNKNKFWKSTWSVLLSQKTDT